MSNLNVTYGEMKSAAGQLNSGEEELKQKLTALQNIITNLVHEGFQTDKAGPAFKESYDKFTTGATQAVSGIEGMSKFLTSAADAMEGLDTQLGSSVSGS